MSLKKIQQIKADKGFKIWDLLVYGVIVLLVAALLLSFFLTADRSPAEGIRITYRGETVFEYVYGDDTYRILSEDNIEILSDTADKLTLDFYTDGKEGYNRVVIDKANKTAKVTEADCSARKDCVYMPAVADHSTFIVCMRHSMKIEPLDPVTVDDGTILT